PIPTRPNPGWPSPQSSGTATGRSTRTRRGLRPSPGIISTRPEVPPRQATAATLQHEEPVPMMELGLSVRHHGDLATIHIRGEIDLATCPLLQAIVVDLVDRGCHQLIVDLERVSFLDCGGIRVLVDARRRVQEHGGSVTLVRPRPPVWRVLALT